MLDITRADPAASTIGEPPLEAYTTIAWRYKWWVLATALIGAAAGFVYGWTRPPVFEARSILTVSPVDATPTPPGRLRAFLVNQSLIAQVIAELGLDRPPHSVTPATFVKNNLAVDELVPGSMLQVRVRLSQPTVSAQVCNRLVALAIELNRQGNIDESQSAEQLIHKQLDTSRLQLEDLKAKLLAFKSEAHLDLRRAEVQSVLERQRELSDLEIRLAAERGRLAATTSELARRSRILPAPRAANPMGAALERSAASSATPEPTAPATGVASPSHVADPATDERAAQLLAGSNAMIDPVYEILDYDAANGRVRVAELESRRRALVNSLGEADTRLKPLKELYKRETEQARLEADYQLASTTYENLFTRYQEARIQIMSSSSELKLIDKALVPTSPTNPAPSVAASLGGAAGLLLGLMGAFVNEGVRRSKIR
jgi:succinoglycan biosynthesis transport protein ExoP